MMPEKWSKNLEERLRINLVHLFYRTYNIISFIFILHLGSCIQLSTRLSYMSYTCHRQAELKMYKAETIFLPKLVPFLLGLIFVNGNILLCKAETWEPS